MKRSMFFKRTIKYFVSGLTGELREANVTIINNRDCAKYLQGNTTNQLILKTKLQLALQDGINKGLICATGDLKEETKLYSVNYNYWYTKY